MTLYPYQADGVTWLTPRKTALLADEMGLGKTPQALMAAVPPVLVVCPAIARPMWSRQAQAWRGWTLSIVSGGSSIWSQDGAIVSYNGLENTAVLGTLTAQRWGTLILDEGHFLKSPDAQRTRNVLGKGGLAHHADRIWCLTGTPMPNHPGELWPMMFVLGATKLRYPAWVATYCNVDDTGKIRGAKQSAAPELRALLAGFCLRRTKKQVGLQLPPLTIDTVEVEAGEVDMEQFFKVDTLPVEGREYDGLSNERHFQAIASASDVDWNTEALRKKLNALVADQTAKVDAAGDDYSGLFDHVATLRRYVGLQKVPAIAELVRQELESDAYHKLVIFAWHRAVIEELLVRFNVKGAKLHAKALYGGTPPETKQKIIDMFQNNVTNPRIVICNLNAVGTAIDLTAASQVIFAEYDWTPATNQQAVARCHRIGQEMPVNARIITLKGSLDERIGAAVARKMRDIKALGLD